MKKITFLFAIVVLLAACSGNKEEKQKMISKITEMEKKFEVQSKEQKIDPTMVRDLANEYSAYGNQFPRDTNAPKMIYKAAVINLKYTYDYNKAIDLFIRLKERYPKYSETPMALYTAAYIYNDLLHNVEKAKECYELLIKDYPNHNLAAEAKVLIQFVGKSDEQQLNAIIGKQISTNEPQEEKEK